MTEKQKKTNKNILFSGNVYVITEYMTGGSLLNQIKNACTPQMQIFYDFLPHL